MKIFIVGGSGYLGRNLVQSLSDVGHEVISVSRNPFEWGLHLNIHSVNSNFANFDFDHIEIQGSVLIFLATPMLSREYLPPPVTDQYLRDLRNFYLKCIKYGVERFIYSSSGGSVYGENYIHNKKWKETDLLNPVSQYGILKKRSEEMLLGIENKDLVLVIVRIANPFGYISEVKKGNRLFLEYLQNSSQTNSPITLFNEGSLVRDYFPMKELVSMVHLLIEGSPSYSVYNLGSGQGISMREILRILESAKDTSLNYANKEKPIDEPLINILDMSRFTSEFSWKPTLNIRKELSLFFEDQKFNN